MNKQPYPNQAGPKKKKPNMDSDLRNKMEMPRKIGKRNPNALKEAFVIPKPARKTKPAVKHEMGIMGSSTDQAKQRKEKALLDMRKRGMLRKKQGQ